MGDKPTAKERKVKMFYCIYFPLFFFSLMAGAITSETEGQAIVSAQVSLGAVVLIVKLWLLITKQSQIIGMLNLVCTFSIRYDEDLTFVNKKLRGFAIFAIILCTVILIYSIVIALLPFFTSERNLFITIGFPVDYKNSDIAFCFANFFLFTGLLFAIIVVFFSVIIWYSLLCCSLRYDVLGSEMKKIGRIRETEGGKLTEKQRHSVFLQDLKAAIDTHLHINGYYSNVIDLSLLLRLNCQFSIDC